MITKDVCIRTCGSVGMLSLPLMALAAVLRALGGGDIREGAFPWLVAATAASMMLYANGLWNLPRHTKNRVLRAAAASLFIGFLGLMATFGGIAIGAALGLSEPGGLIGMGPIVGGIMAVAGIPLGFALLGIVMFRKRLFPPWARAVPILLALNVPVGMVAIGATDGTLETVVSVIWLGSFGLLWTVMGYALSRAVARQSGPHLLVP